MSRINVQNLFQIKYGIVVIVAISALHMSNVGFGENLGTFKPVTTLAAPEIKDQDDMCVWVHLTKPENSTVICSDKSANALFVYNLSGKLLQHIPGSKPGNIDIRQGVKLDGKVIDLVVVNQRADGYKLRAYQVDQESGKLERVDEETLVTGPNYGGCLYHSAKSGRLFFICTSDKGTVEQHELLGNGKGKVIGKKVREFPLGKCEGAVADDETATLFVGEEKGGVWKFAAEPDGSNDGTLIVKVGERSLKGDVEGLAIYRQDPQDGYLFVSDQGQNRFMVYQRQSPHAFVGEFAIEGAKDSDGIEISAASFGAKLPKGFFACHTGLVPHGVLLTPLDDILAKLPKQPASSAAQK